MKKGSIFLMLLFVPLLVLFVNVTTGDLLVNIAEGKPVYATTEFDPLSPTVANITDNSVNYWESSTEELYTQPQFIYVDLLSVESNIDNITLFFENGYQPRIFQVFASYDAETWIPVTSEEYYPHLPDPTVIPTPVNMFGGSYYQWVYEYPETDRGSFRYLAVYFVRKANWKNKYRLAELQVNQVLAPAM